MLKTGERLGPYEIVGELGAGGMGRVYKARDTRLNRAVAIKILSGRLTNDPEFHDRFQREARAISALDHPRICPLHDVGVYRGAAFLVMPFLEGETLADRLTRGAMPLAEVLSVAIDIGDALDAAHSAGIIHRDVKPGNIMLTKSGARLLDFGLSKIASVATADDAAQLPTVPVTGTAHGVILGTPQYMSPEQLTSGQADARGDLFALGAVIYEMATGQCAFAGSSSAIVIAAILDFEPPPVSRARTSIPAAVDHIVARCLRKDRMQRWQTARDLVAELKWVAASAASASLAAAAAPAPRRNSRAIATVSTLAAGAAFFLGIAIGQRRTSGIDQVINETRLEQLTANPDEQPVYGAAISPDGKFLAYTDASGLYLRLTDSGDTRPVPVPDGWRFWDVSWFPDSTRLLVTGEPATGAPLSLFAVATIGGPPRKLQDDAWRAAVAPDGSAIVFIRTRYPIRDVWMMGAGGENAHRIVAGNQDDTFWQVGWSPDSRRVVVGKTSGAAGELSSVLESRNRDGGAPAVLMSSPRLFQNWRGVLPFAWLRNGGLVFAMREPEPNEATSNLWRVDIAERNGVPHPSQPRRLTQLGSDDVRDLRATADGGRLSFLRERHQMDVYVAPFDAALRRVGDARRLTFDDRDDQPGGWTPDGTQMVFQSWRAGSIDIFRQRVDAIPAEPLVVAPGADMNPRVTPDGAWVMYRHDRRLMRVPTGGGPFEPVVEGHGPIATDCALPPARRCVMSELIGQEMVFSEVQPVGGRGRELGRVITASRDFTNWRLSPDGARVALVEFTDRIRVIDLGDSHTVNLNVSSWTAFEFVGWAHDGNGVFVTGLSADGPRLIRVGLLHVDLQGRATVVRHLPNEWVSHPVAAPDGRSIAFGVMKLASNAWTLDQF